MSKYIITIGIFIGAFFIVFDLSAANPFDFKFPIAELGNCGSLEACREYCDSPKNAKACLSFAEKRGLVTKEQASKSLKFVEQLQKGDAPVKGCSSEDECREMCKQPEHREACYQWAKRHGYAKDREEAVERIRSKVEVKHEKEFDKQKLVQLIESDGGPGNCGSYDACRDFCEKSDNQKACFEYARKHGLISGDEAKKMERIINKPGPGGCRGETCRQYCEMEENHDECLEFAVENGFIEKDEADRVKKFKEAAGPGGCRGEECRSYCEDPSHHEECFRFAKDNDLIRPEELERMEQKRRQMDEERKRHEEFRREEDGNRYKYYDDKKEIPEDLNRDKPIYSIQPIQSYRVEPLEPSYEVKPEYREYNRDEFNTATHEPAPLPIKEPYSTSKSFLNQGLGLLLKYLFIR